MRLIAVFLVAGITALVMIAVTHNTRVPQSPMLTMCESLVDLSAALDELEGADENAILASYMQEQRQLDTAAARVSDASRLEWCCEYGAMVPIGSREIEDAVAAYEALLDASSDGERADWRPEDVDAARDEALLQVSELHAYLDCSNVRE